MLKDEAKYKPCEKLGSELKFLFQTAPSFFSVNQKLTDHWVRWAPTHRPPACATVLQNTEVHVSQKIPVLNISREGEATICTKFLRHLEHVT